MSLHHLKRAHQLYELNRYEACYQEARKALQFDPEDGETHFLLILTLIQLEKYDEAESHGKNALTFHPDSDQILYLLGVIYIEKDENAKARDHLEAAIRIDPEVSEYFYQMARMHLGFGQWEKAQKMLHHSLHLNPNNASALRLLSLVEQQTTSESKAKQSANKALNLAPENANSHLVKALIHWDNKEFEKAESHLKTMVQLNPSDSENLALWQECRTRTSPKWNSIINPIAGNGHNLIRPFLILGIGTFLSNVLIYNNIHTGIIFWTFGLLFFFPMVIYWFIRPYLKFSFFNKKFSWAAFEMANPSLPIEALACLNILATIIYWISKIGIFFGISFLSLLIGVGMAYLENTESNYPVFNRPLRKSGIMILAVLSLATLFFILYQMDQTS